MLNSKQGFQGMVVLHFSGFLRNGKRPFVWKTGILFLCGEIWIIYIKFKTAKWPNQILQFFSKWFYWRKSLCPLFFIKFLFLHQMTALQKLWKVSFISSKKLFSFLRYSNFCNIFPSFPQFPDTKGQMEVE